MISTERQTKELATRMNVGLIYWCEEKPDEAIKHYESLMPEFESCGDILLLAKLHNNLGIAFYQKAELSGDSRYFYSTISEYETAREYLNQTDDLPTIGVVENNIG